MTPEEVAKLFEELNQAVRQSDAIGGPSGGLGYYVCVVLPNAFMTSCCAVILLVGTLLLVLGVLANNKAQDKVASTCGLACTLRRLDASNTTATSSGGGGGGSQAAGGALLAAMVFFGLINYYCNHRRYKAVLEALSDVLTSHTLSNRAPLTAILDHAKAHDKAIPEPTEPAVQALHEKLMEA